MGKWLITGAFSLVSVSLAAGEVDVESLSGQAIRGRLVAMSTSKLVVDGANGQTTIAASDLLTVTPTGGRAAEASPTKYWIRLVDGSFVLASRYSVKSREATILVVNGVEVRVPTRTIAWVRFREPDPALESQWKEIVGQEVAGDVVVVHKPPATLVQAEGVLQDIDENTVNFEVDDNVIPVGIKKLEGIVYFHPLGRKEVRPLCRVATSDGSTWHTKSLELTGEEVKLTTVGGAALKLPLDRIRMFDYSSGNVVYLSDLEMESATWTPYVESALPAEVLFKTYGPLRDRAFFGGKLQLDSQEFQKGLALRSRTEIVYRLTDEYRRFQAIAGIDPSMGNNGDVELVVSGDNKVLHRIDVKGGQDPIRLDIELKGVRRLTVLVDWNGNDVSDLLNLCNARIIK